MEKTQGECQLYDLTKNETESNNVANEYPEIVVQIQSIMKEAWTDSGIFPLSMINSSCFFKKH